jgi:hypothetical protein
MAPAPGKVRVMTEKGSKDDGWAGRTSGSMRWTSIEAMPSTVIGGLEIDGEAQEKVLIAEDISWWYTVEVVNVANRFRVLVLSRTSSDEKRQ